MDPTSDASPRPLGHVLLAYLLRRARAQAGFDLAIAAARWGQPVSRLEAIEAGTDVPDWWDVRGLLAAYDLSFPGFAHDYDRRCADVCAEPTDLPLATSRTDPVRSSPGSS